MSQSGSGICLTLVVELGLEHRAPVSQSTSQKPSSVLEEINLAESRNVLDLTSMDDGDGSDSALAKHHHYFTAETALNFISRAF